MKMKNKTKGIIRDYLLIIVGSALAAFALNIFLIPYKVAPGGVSGIAMVIHYLSGEKLPVGGIMLAINLPLFLVGFGLIGKRFAIRTLVGTLLLSFIIDGTEPISRYIVEHYLTKLQPSTLYPDLLLYALSGGFVMGVGLGMVFRAGATTGGTDLAARIAKHFKPGVTMGTMMLLIDTGVVTFATIAFGSIQLGLYAIVTLFISSKVIDAILEGINFSKAVFIISEESDEIARRILKDLDRGVTALKGTGMYTRNEKQVLLCVIQRGQVPELQAVVKEIDPRAFVILTDIREVLGEGFKTYD